jgi:hypothetical protein
VCADIEWERVELPHFGPSTTDVQSLVVPGGDHPEELIPLRRVGRARCSVGALTAARRKGLRRRTLLVARPECKTGLVRPLAVRTPASGTHANSCLPVPSSGHPCLLALHFLEFVALPPASTGRPQYGRRARDG